MIRQTVRSVGLLSLLFVAWGFNAWGMSPQVLELEMMKQRDKKRESWKSEGPVHKSDIPGFYRHSPGDSNAFWLKSDGTGLLYGGQRGIGIWNIMWAFHEDKGGVLCIRSVQLKREYKVIRKNGKVWMVEGREIWRQHVSMNAPVRQPRDRAQFVSIMPPEELQSVGAK